MINITLHSYFMYNRLKLTKSQGDGTENNPYVAGIQENINLLSSGRGGLILLDAGRYDISSALEINGDCVSIQGISSGRQQNPNGLYEGIWGTKLRFSSTGIKYLNNSNRYGNSNLKDLYLFSPTTLQSENSGFSGTCGISVEGAIEQTIWENLKTNHLDVAIKITNANAGIDVVNIDKLLILGGRHGIVATQVGSYGAGYMTVENTVIADNIGYCSYFSGITWVGLVIKNCAFVRGANASNLPNACNVYFNTSDSKFQDNDILYAGKILVTYSENGIIYNANTQRAAHGMILAGNNNIISGNNFNYNAGGYGLYVSGSNNKIINNNFKSNGTGDIYISGNDNIIEHFGATITDNGSRNIINGITRNIGDPNSTGVWNGVSKIEGLKIYDSQNSIMYLYSSTFSNGRKII